ncbi:MAG: hypothetical protein U9Q92_02825 [archaeon]|nr:hypothetical protein [archaeon]
MIETITHIGRGFIPNKTTLKVFSIFIILFFITLKSNPIESALTAVTPFHLYKYHSIIAPFTPAAEQDSFGAKKYCQEAAGVVKCFILYPGKNIQNISLWYIISAVITGLITRFGIGGKET